MIRLVLVLGVGLFAALLIGGQDRGQLRFGLMPSKDAPVARPVSPAPTAKVVVVQAKVAVRPAQVQDASFAPDAPVMITPVAPEPTPVQTEAGQAKAGPADAGLAIGQVLYVSAKSVNVREGPGKDFGIVSRLSRGEAVLVVTAGTGSDGWSLIRIEGDGVEGYVAARLLTE